MPTDNGWPMLDYGTWRDTGTALHLYAQILGKYRLAHTPWINHSWHATFYVTPRGLTTGPIPDPGGTVTVDVDFRDHAVVATAASGVRESFPLEPMNVAAFLDRSRTMLEAVGGTFDIHGAPNELPDVVPFAQDRAERPYDRAAVEVFHGALLSIEPVFTKFRSGFIGKVSPVHLFWGAFDLAVTRFSGLKGPLHPGGFPNLPDSVTQEAYSHEVSSAGFWPGGGGIDEACFYAYAYPAPDGFADAAMSVDGARYDRDLGEFVLPYERVRQASDPAGALLQFLQETYEAAADAAGWDRDALECAIGEPRVPRAL